MNLQWSDFPDAPNVGTRVCAVSEMMDGVQSINIGDFPVLIIQDHMGTRAFVNACPHQFLPLDQRGTVQSQDGSRLICSNHDAVFDAISGEGVSGLGTGTCLSSIPIKQVAQAWVIAE